MKVFTVIENEYGFNGYEDNAIVGSNLIGTYSTREKAEEALSTCSTRYETCASGCCVDTVTNGVIYETELE